MENFITGEFGIIHDSHDSQHTLYLGYPGCEFHIRDALTKVLGKEKSEFFFDKVC